MRLMFCTDKDKGFRQIFEGCQKRILYGEDKIDELVDDEVDLMKYWNELFSRL